MAKRRQTLSPFSQVSLKIRSHDIFMNYLTTFFSRKRSLFLCTFAVILQCWLSRRTESGSKSEGINKEIITKLSINRFMSSLEPDWRFRGTWYMKNTRIQCRRHGFNSRLMQVFFFLENNEMQFIQSLKC